MQPLVCKGKRNENKIISKSLSRVMYLKHRSPPILITNLKHNLRRSVNKRQIIEV